VIKPVEFHEAAFSELDAAFDWYFARSARVAAAFLDEIDRALDLISSSPQTWPLYHQNTRKFVLKRFPFLLVYREKASTIQVIAVAHGRRRPYYWKMRL
jgi:toxin ParE1/3/4